MRGGTGALDPGLVDEVVLVLLPFGVGNGLELIAGNSGNVDVERMNAGLGEFVSEARADVCAGFGSPFADMDFRHGVD